MSALAPKPSASVSTTIALNAGFRPSWRVATRRTFMRLLLSQRFHGIDSRRSQGRDHGREGCDADDDRDDARERRRIERRYAVEHGRERAPQRERQRDANED